MMATCPFLESQLNQIQTDKELKETECSKLESNLANLQEKVVQYEQEIAAFALKHASSVKESKEIFRLQETIQGSALMLFAYMSF